ncbi:MAG: peptidase MA family metallohydrolase [Anaerolineae bacterium]|nr:peptidase MA family metallohydrolase [Anaerolineae bacterium]
MQLTDYLFSLPFRIVGSLLLAAVLLTTGVQALHAQGEVTFGETTFVNNFPDSLMFSSTATSTDGDIVKAELVYGVRRNLGSESRTRVAVPVEPGATVDLTYFLDTDGTTSAPSTPYFFHWRVMTEDGVVHESAEQLVRYDDSRFDWDVFAGDKVEVWTHDRNLSLGEDALAIAQEALRRQQPLFGEELAFPIRIIVYNDKDEFAAWHAVRDDAVGGQAFSDMGITTQIVDGFGSHRSWLEDVVPHEISHLYYYQVSENPSSPTPHWLNEGVAQYNEFHEHDGSVRAVRRAAEDGDLLLLTALEDGFGGDEQRFRFSYDVAVSAIVYLVETYGETGMAALLRAYQSGFVTDDAFAQALGLPFDQFQRDWISWLGVSPEQYPTPTPWPFPTPFPSPTPMVFATATPNSDGDMDSAEITPTNTPVAIAEAATATPTPSPMPLATPSPTRQSSGQEAVGIDLCGSLGLIAPLLIVGAIPVWRRKRKNTTA